MGLSIHFGISQKSVEIKLMQKFTSNQFVKDTPLPAKFQEHFKPVIETLLAKQAVHLQELYK